MAKNNLKNGAPAVHEDLMGFNIKINTFGEITANLGVEKLNEFLDEKVIDKKLIEHENVSQKSENQPKE